MQKYKWKTMTVRAGNLASTLDTFNADGFEVFNIFAHRVETALVGQQYTIVGRQEIPAETKAAGEPAGRTGFK